MVFKILRGAIAPIAPPWIRHWMRIYSEVASARLVQDLAIEKKLKMSKNMKSLHIIVYNSFKFFKPFKKTISADILEVQKD